MRRKFVQIAAIVLALSLLPVSYVGAETGTEQTENDAAIIENTEASSTASEVEMSPPVNEESDAGNASHPVQGPEDSEEVSVDSEKDEPIDPEQGTTGEEEEPTDPEQGTTGEEEDPTDPEQGATGEEEDPSEPEQGTTGEEEDPSEPEQGTTGEEEDPTDPEQGTTGEGEEPTDPEQGTTGEGEEPTDPEQGTTGEGEEPTDPEQGTTGEGEEPTDPEQGTTEPEVPQIPDVENPAVVIEPVVGNIVRIGLRYGSSAVSGGNLSITTGNGFRFGFQTNDGFCKIGYTGQNAISVVKTTNVYYSAKLSDNYSGYSDSVVTSVAVGCVHLQIPGSYASFEDAKAKADEVGGFPAWIDGRFRVRIGVYLTADDARAAQSALGLNDAELVGTSSKGFTVVITGTSTPIFQYDSSSVPMFVVKPGLDDSIKTETYFKGYKYYGSFRYERIDGGDITVVNLVDMEDYVRGILPYEMSSSWPLEALKAQAVCARSYTMSSLNWHSRHHFDLCTTTDCQVYHGTGSATERTEQAVVETSCQYAWYDGQIILAVYHGSNGGATANSETVWNEALPYLRGVVDTFEPLVANKISSYSWTKSYTGKQLQSILNKEGFGCAEIANVTINPTQSGTVASITFTDVNGKKYTLSKERNLRSLIGCKSMYYTVSGGNDNEYSLTGDQTVNSLSGMWALSGDGTMVQVSAAPVYAMTAEGVVEVPGSTVSSDSFEFSGAGNGHNLGLSQWGAYSMAQEGYTYDQILKFYFTGIEIHE